MLATVSNPRTPQWHTTATYHETPEPEMLTVQDVAAQTGLRASYILSTVNNPAGETGPRARMRSLARPDYNVSGVPYWSRRQVADYHKQVNARYNVGTGGLDLPLIEENAAREIEAVSLREINRQTGVPLTTLYRWMRMTGFPAPIAVMDVNSPTPQRLYHLPTVLKHLRDSHAEWFAEQKRAKDADS